MLNMDDLTDFQCLETALVYLKEFHRRTTVNALDNYSYREYSSNIQLKSYLPSIFKKPGRSGDDATAIKEGYEHIEQKSGTINAKTLTISNFPKGEFDKQADPARRAHLFNYDGLLLSCFRPFQAYPVALVFVPKEQMPKLHDLMKFKQEEKIKIFEENKANGKNIGRDTITISLEDVLSNVDKSDLICYYEGNRIDPTTFINDLTNGIDL